MWRHRIIFAAASILAVTRPAAAQTQPQQDRLDQVARFAVTAPVCQRLGMTVDPALPEKSEAALDAETAGWRLDPVLAKRLRGEAVARQSRIITTDLQAASDGAKTEAQLRALSGIFLGYGRICLAATRDPIFAGLIVAPPGYDVAKAATDAADALLAGGGLASWQTPQIQARGDLMMLAGTCRSKIGAERSDALVKAFGQSDDARTRDYYRRSFDEGLADPTIIGTLAGCNRAIAASRARLR